MTYLWNRLPDELHTTLLNAYDGNDYAGVLTLLNRYYVAPEMLAMCCGLGEAWEEIAEAERTEQITRL